ncbi:MAG: hypothetical protein ACOYYU_20105, partial [Chloroflexota bacterium]
KNEFTFSPTIAPTQMDFYSAAYDYLPEKYNNTFFLGMSGTYRGIINIPNTTYSEQQDNVPEIFLNYLGKTTGDRYSGIVAALSFGPDGLYFAPITLNDANEMTVYKISYDPEHEHPFRRNEYTLPDILINAVNCTSCHTLRGKGAGTAPDITPKVMLPRITTALNSPKFEDWWRQLNEMDDEILKQHTDDRNHLLELHGEERAWYWTYYHLMEPRFDNPEAAMPNLGLTEVQAVSLANYFIGDLKEIQAREAAAATEAEAAANTGGSAPSFNFNFNIVERMRALRENLPPVGYRFVAIIFVAGVLLGAGGFWLVVRKKLKKQAK